MKRAILNISDEQAQTVRAVFKDSAAVWRIFASNERLKPVAQMEWRELVDLRHELMAECRKALATWTDEKRNPTTQEGEAFDVLQNIVDDYDREMNWRDSLGDRGPRNLQSGRVSSAAAEKKDDGIVIGKDHESGREVRAYRHADSLTQRFHSHARDGHDGLTLGKLLNGWVFGRWASRDEEQRALSLGTPSAGGYSVPAPITAQFVDLARAQSVCSQAGARVIPMDSNTLDMVKITADPTLYWRAENVAITASDPTFGRVRFTAKTCGALIKTSEEMYQDSVNAPEKLEEALRNAFATEMDRVMLVGSGSGDEPTGIRLTSGVNALDNYPTGRITTFDPFIDSIQAIREDNFEPSAVVMSPRTASQIGKLKDTTNQPLMAPVDFANLQKFVTSAIPDNLTTAGSPSASGQSVAILGDFREAAWGVRLNPTIIISNAAGDNGGGAFSAYQFWIRMVMRIDVQLFRAGAFGLVRDIAAS